MRNFYLPLKEFKLEAFPIRRTIRNNILCPIYKAQQTSNYGTSALLIILPRTFLSRVLYLILSSESLCTYFSLSVSEPSGSREFLSHMCRVPICASVIKFGHFLLLTCLTSILLLDQLKEPRKTEGSFFLPHTLAN